MQKREKNPAKPKNRVRFILMNSVRVILVLAFLGSLYTGRNLILMISVLAFFITYLPLILEKSFKLKITAESEIIIILFVYGILFLGEVRGLFAEFLWWDMLLNFIAAIALGFTGLTVMYVLYRDKKINASPFVIAIFAFSFAMAIGAVWEIFEFSLDSLLGFNLQKSSVFESALADTMGDIIVNGVGALLVSAVGYFYIKSGKIIFVSSFIEKLIERNPKLFKSQKYADSNEGLLDLIKKGEHNKLEFKSTLRTNLHTGEIDKRMEHSVLKTITAYLNSNGGTLLVGVSDKGEITGIKKDNFPDNDKLNLHLTNLIREHVGNEYLPFIKQELITVDGKSILKIDCSESQKHVFLKLGKIEEFYVRNGPASTRLDGSSLINYINHKFSQK